MKVKSDGLGFLWIDIVLPLVRLQPEGAFEAQNLPYLQQRKVTNSLSGEDREFGCVSLRCATEDKAYRALAISRSPRERPFVHPLSWWRYNYPSYMRGKINLFIL